MKCINPPRNRSKRSTTKFTLPENAGRFFILLPSLCLIKTTTKKKKKKKKKNSSQLIFKYVFSKIFHYNYRCDQQNYIIIEVATRLFSKKYKMSNKD